MKKYLLRKLSLSDQDYRRILGITGPAMLELIMSQLFAMVDTIMLGHTTMSAVAIAAVGLTNNPVNLPLGILTAFNVGTTASIAWAIGGKDVPGGRALGRTALGLNLMLGTLATVIGVAFAAPIVTFMGAQADTFTYARDYMRIVSWGFLPAAINMSVTATLRAAGQTRQPMLYNMGANLLNVVGNWVLIFGHLGFPRLGVAGAAISTTFSRVAGAAAALWVLYGTDTQVRLKIRDGISLRWQHVRRILKIGATTAAEQTLMQIGFMLFARSVSALGTVMFAAHQIGLSINGLTWVPAQAFGVAGTTLVGQYMGAGEPQRAKECAIVTQRATMVGNLFVAVLFLVGASWFARLYTNDAAVIAVTATVLRIMMLGMPGVAIQLPYASALRGAGDAIFPLMASFAGIWIFRVLLAPVFMHTLGWGLNGAWICISLDQLMRACVVSARFHHGGWMKRAAKPAAVTE